MAVCDRVREHREAKGWSLRKLAHKSKVSASLISQIETGKVDPSLSTLRKIALALDVPLFYFVLENPSEATKIVRKSDRRTVAFPESGLVYQIFHSNQGKKMGIHLGTLQKGGMTSNEPMPHQGEECLIVVEGRMKVQVGKEILWLESGDSLYFDSSVPHQLMNEDEQDCKFYLIITPPKF
jgi:transcriptional regulator with XRE-family HTH domain